MSDIGKFKAHDRTVIGLAEEAADRVEEKVSNLTQKISDVEASIKNLERREKKGLLSNLK